MTDIVYGNYPIRCGFILSHDLTTRCMTLFEYFRLVMSWAYIIQVEKEGEPTESDRWLYAAIVALNWTILLSSVRVCTLFRSTGHKCFYTLIMCLKWVVILMIAFMTFASFWYFYKTKNDSERTQLKTFVEFYWLFFGDVEGTREYLDEAKDAVYS